MDLSMYGSSYRTWSRDLTAIAAGEEYREPAEAYLRLAARPTTRSGVDRGLSAAAVGFWYVR